jgi:hypothetical protein
MFDRATCEGTRFVDKPQVDVAALLALRNLLGIVELAGCAGAEQAKHHSLSALGGANAERKETAAASAAELVPTNPNDHCVEDLAQRGSTAKPAVAGAPVARALRKKVAGPQRAGGLR